MKWEVYIVVPERVEELSVHAVMQLFLTTGLIDVSDIKSNDKTPSWDGSITLYNDESRKKDNIYGRADIQIKGHEVKKDELSKESIQETVSVADLKNYIKEGGVLYFIVNLTEFGNSVYCIDWMSFQR